MARVLRPSGAVAAFGFCRVPTLVGIIGNGAGNPAPLLAVP